MNESNPVLVRVLEHGVYSVFTLYMVAILLRWVAPFIEINIHSPRWRWLPGITDPVLRLLRRYLPPLGSFDAAPILAVMCVWLIRMIVVGI